MKRGVLWAYWFTALVLVRTRSCTHGTVATGDGQPLGGPGAHFAFGRSTGVGWGVGFALSLFLAGGAGHLLGRPVGILLYRKRTQPKETECTVEPREDPILTTV